MSDHKRKRDDEEAKEDVAAGVAAATGAAAGAAAGAGAAAAAGAGAAGAGAADTKKQKTATALAAALAAAETAGISPKVNYGPDEQQQAYAGARTTYKFWMGKLLERFEQAFPHVENIRAHMSVDTLEDSESLDKSFKVLRKFFRRGKDDTAHGQHALDIMYLSSFTPLGFAIVNGESHQDEPWAPVIQEMHRSRIQAAKARIEKWEAAGAAGGAAGGAGEAADE